MRLILRLSKPPLDDVIALPDILLVSLWLVAQKGLFGFIQGLFWFSFLCSNSNTTSQDRLGQIHVFASLVQNIFRIRTTSHLTAF